MQQAQCVRLVWLPAWSWTRGFQTVLLVLKSFFNVFLLIFVCEFWFCTSYIKQIMNVFSFVEWNKYRIFILWKMKCTIQFGFAKLNGTFHLSPNKNICTIALINIHFCILFTDNHEVHLEKRTINYGLSS